MLVERAGPHRGRHPRPARRHAGRDDRAARRPGRGARPQRPDRDRPRPAGRSPPWPAADSAAFRTELALTLAEFLARLEQAAGREPRPSPGAALAPARLRRPADAGGRRARPPPPPARRSPCAWPSRAACAPSAPSGSPASCRPGRRAERGRRRPRRPRASACRRPRRRGGARGVPALADPGAGRRAAAAPPPRAPAAAAPAEVLRFQRPPSPRPRAEAAPCDLERLEGVGPGLVWALRRAGIRDLAGLAALEPAGLAARLGPIGRLVPAEAWIATARGETGA